MDFALDDLTGFLNENALGLGLGAQVAGILLKNRAAKKTENQRQAYLAAENARQKRLFEQAEAARLAAQSRFTPEQQTAMRAENATRGAEALAPTYTPQYEASLSEQPAEVKTEVARKMTEAMKRGRESARGLAGINAYGSVGLDNDIALRRSGGDIRRLAGQGGASSSILQGELQYGAPQAGANLYAAGDIAGGLGNIASLYAMTRRPAVRPQQRPAPVEDRSTIYKG